MKIIKKSNVEAFQAQQKAEKEQLITKINSLSKECKCNRCGSIFLIGINDIAGWSVDEGYVCFCPVCEKLLTFGINVGELGLDYTHYSLVKDHIAGVINKNRKKFIKLYKKNR